MYAVIYWRRLGKVLSYLYQKMRLTIPYAYEHRAVSIMWTAEVFVAIAKKLLDEPTTSVDELVHIIKTHAMKDIEDKLRLNTYRAFDPNFDVYSQMVCQSTFADENTSINMECISVIMNTDYLNISKIG